MRQAAETLLLRACLWEADAARAAFAEWAKLPSEALAMLQRNAGLKRRLLPLLQAAAERNHFDVPAELQPLLRAAALYEQLRTEAYREIAANVLSTLNVSGMSFLATRGVVFSPWLYRDAGLRHCHDIDLLVRREDRRAAADLLVSECGFELREQTGAPPESLLLYHSSGLPLLLHTRLLPSPAMRLAVSVEEPAHVEAYGGTVPTLSPTLALLHVLLHGPFSPQGESLIWLCDACQLLRQITIDWDAFHKAIAGDAQLLAVRTGLRYLSSELKAGIPAAVLQEIERRWSTLPRAKRSAAEELLLLVQLRQGVAGRRDVLRSARRESGVLRAVRLLVFPSTEGLLRSGHIDATGQALAFRAKQVMSMLRHFYDTFPVR